MCFLVRLRIVNLLGLLNVVFLHVIAHDREEIEQVYVQDLVVVVNVQEVDDEAVGDNFFVIRLPPFVELVCRIRIYGDECLKELVVVRNGNVGAVGSVGAHHDVYQCHDVLLEVQGDHVVFVIKLDFRISVVRMRYSSFVLWFISHSSKLPELFPPRSRT